MGTLNVIVEQKHCKCARASESGGKQGWQSREGVKADWEKQRQLPEGTLNGAETHSPVKKGKSFQEEKY